MSCQASPVVYEEGPELFWGHLRLAATAWVADRLIQNEFKIPHLRKDVFNMFLTHPKHSLLKLKSHKDSWSTSPVKAPPAAFSDALQGPNRDWHANLCLGFSSWQWWDFKSYRTWKSSNLLPRTAPCNLTPPPGSVGWCVWTSTTRCAYVINTSPKAPCQSLQTNLQLPLLSSAIWSSLLNKPPPPLCHSSGPLRHSQHHLKSNTTHDTHSCGEKFKEVTFIGFKSVDVLY